MDPEPPNYLSSLLLINLISFNDSIELVILVVLLLLLIISSAMISGSEIAFFSLNNKNLEEFEENDALTADKINELIGYKDTSSSTKTLKKKEKKLLATILIVNNFINIAIVIVSDYFIKLLIGQELLERWGVWVKEILNIAYFSSIEIGNVINFLITVVGVTFVLVLFGEVLPKIYANVNNMHFSKLMASPLIFLNKRFSFLSNLLVDSTELMERKWASKMSDRSISKEHIDKAIDLTVEKSKKNKDELDILKGIVKFNEVSIKEIMVPRVDIISIDIDTSMVELLKIIRSSGYSRIPVHKDNIDHIEGILYVKDLIGKKDIEGFKWQDVIRKDVIYTPETKKIKEQLREFQTKKVHLAIVVDEYGGSEGLITLEDIMEEIIGEISDEFDSNRSIDFIKVNKKNYIFDGKTSLHDVAKLMDIDSDIFDNFKGEADSIAGLILELNGILPQKLTEFDLENILLIVSEVSDRRIVKVQVKLK